MSVKRYTIYYNERESDMYVAESQDGKYCLHSDYAALRARVARLEEALRFILDECDWEESMQHACGDNRIGTAARRALEEK